MEATVIYSFLHIQEEEERKKKKEQRRRRRAEEKKKKKKKKSSEALAMASPDNLQSSGYSVSLGFRPIAIAI